MRSCLHLDLHAGKIIARAQTTWMDKRLGRPNINPPAKQQDRKRWPWTGETKARHNSVSGQFKRNTV